MQGTAMHIEVLTWLLLRKDTKTVTTPGVIKGLKNVFLAGQWLMGSGGLPPATAQGKYAAWRICKKEHVECR